MGWLQGVPQCRCEGPLVSVTLDLDPEEIPSAPRYLVWSATGLTASTSKSSDRSMSCCLPRGIFERRTLVKLELLPAYPSDRVVRAWTHIPTLGQATFHARMLEGKPVLAPVESEAPLAARSHTTSFFVLLSCSGGERSTVRRQ
jgi:hypothetical protein